MKYTKENSKTISFRVTIEEYEKIKNMAGEKELTVFIRNVLLGQAVSSELAKRFDDLYSYLEGKFSTRNLKGVATNRDGEIIN